MTRVDAPRVMTVLGPIDPADLGVTLAHEHLLIDLRFLADPPVEDWQRDLVDAVPSLENRGRLAVDPYVSRPNLVLDDLELAANELAVFAKLGGGSLIDLTVEGLGQQPLALAELSRRTGVHIVAGCGFYTKRAHPPMVAEASEQQLAERLLETVVSGFPDTEIKPGILGELGTSAPVHPDEEKVLRAAADVQQATGLAINVHLAIFGREGLHVLDVLERAGTNPSRVVLSHLDEMLDLDYHRAILRRGAYVEFDTFGSEYYFDQHDEREPSDRERVDALLRLLSDGWAQRLLLSQDVCIKSQLVRYGGAGYGHLLRTIVPRLRKRGVDDATLETLLVSNPARVLTPAK